MPLIPSREYLPREWHHICLNFHFPYCSRFPDRMSSLYLGSRRFLLYSFAQTSPLLNISKLRFSTCPNSSPMTARFCYLHFARTSTSSRLILVAFMVTVVRQVHDFGGSTRKLSIAFYGWIKPGGSIFWKSIWSVQECWCPWPSEWRHWLHPLSFARESCHLPSVGRSAR